MVTTCYSINRQRETESQRKRRGGKRREEIGSFQEKNSNKKFKLKIYLVNFSIPFSCIKNIKIILPVEYKTEFFTPPNIILKIFKLHTYR